MEPVTREDEAVATAMNRLFEESGPSSEIEERMIANIIAPVAAAQDVAPAEADEPRPRRPLSRVTAALGLMAIGSIAAIFAFTVTHEHRVTMLGAGAPGASVWPSPPVDPLDDLTVLNANVFADDVIARAAGGERTDQLVRDLAIVGASRASEDRKALARKWTASLVAPMVPTASASPSSSAPKHDPWLMRDDPYAATIDSEAIRQNLQSKVWSGRGTVDEIRQLKAACRALHDDSCKAKADQMLQKKLTQ
jgi:hypothetical protein